MAARRDKAPASGGADRDDDHQGLSRAKAQRGKNLAVLVALIAFVALVYIVAIVRMGGG